MSGLHAFNQVWQRELAHLAANRGDRFAVLWLPPLLGLLLWWIFVSSQPQQLPLAVVDQDNSSLSRSLVQLVEAMPASQISYRLTDNTEALTLLRQRKVYGILLIPDGFATALSRGQSTELLLQHNAQFISHSSQLVRAVQTAVSAFSASISSDRLLRNGLPEPAALPAIMPLQLLTSTLYNETPGYEAFLAASLIPAVLHILVMLSAVSAIGRELRDGTALQWRQAAAGSVFIALTAKLCPYLLLFAFWGTAFILLFSQSGLAPVAGSLPLLLLSMLLMITAALAIGSLLLALSRNLRMALSLTGFYTAPAFAFSGQAFPLVAMPQFAQQWASILPLTHWLDIYNRLWLAGAPINLLLSPLLILLLMSIIPALSAWYLLRRNAFSAANWGAR